MKELSKEDKIKKILAVLETDVMTARKLSVLLNVSVQTIYNIKKGIAGDALLDLALIRIKGIK